MRKNAPKFNEVNKGNENLLKCLEIRLFEELLLDLYDKSLLRGTTHTCIGQEYIPLIYSDLTDKDDFIFSNHRGHGHFLAHTGDFEGLLNEILGNESGICRGIGGSQHLHKGRFFSNGILAGMLPIALGASYRCKNQELSMIYMGDGATSEGLFHETLNFASINEGPLLLVIEDNGIAQSTPSSSYLAGSLSERILSYGLDVITFDSTYDGNTPIQLIKSVEKVRTSRRPMVHIHKCSRLSAHSKGDDTRKKEDISNLKKIDYINTAYSKLEDKAVQFIKEKIRILKEKCLNAKKSKIYYSNSNNHIINNLQQRNDNSLTEIDGNKTYLQELNECLYRIMKEHSEIFLIGEDINDPYGGAFKVTKNLQFNFPKQVISTPVSEAAIAGVVIGLSIEGKASIGEIMFSDFTLLCLDQLINHASKLTLMYGKALKIPAIIRTPLGGYRGYGPTHSQSLEKHFIGNDNLNVIAHNLLITAEEIFGLAILSQYPSVIFENKTDYSKKLISRQSLEQRGFQFNTDRDEQGWPIRKIQLEGDDTSSICIVCYGGMVSKAIQVSQELFVETESTVRIIVPSFISKPSHKIANIIRDWQCSKLVFLSEGTDHGDYMRSLHSLYAQISANMNFQQSTPLFINSTSSIIPSSSEGEFNTLPSHDGIIQQIMEG